jgi:hypothetical protein
MSRLVDTAIIQGHYLLGFFEDAVKTNYCPRNQETIRHLNWLPRCIFRNQPINLTTIKTSHAMV